MLNVFSMILSSFTVNLSYSNLQEFCIGSVIATKHNVYQLILKNILQPEKYTAERCRIGLLNWIHTF